MEEYASNLNKSTWWPLLIEGLSQVGGGHWEYKFYLVTLINVLTNSGFLELEDRVFVRNTLSNFTLDEVLKRLEKDCEKVQGMGDESQREYIFTQKILQQLNVYRVTKQQDDHMKMVESLDLSDPVSLFDKIKENAIQFGYEPQLTRILQNLVIIPNHQRTIRNHVWERVARIVNMICMPLRQNLFEDDPLLEEQKELDQVNKKFMNNGNIKDINIKKALNGKDGNDVVADGAISPITGADEIVTTPDGNDTKNDGEKLCVCFVCFVF